MLILVFQAHTHMYIHTHSYADPKLSPQEPFQVHTSRNAYTEETEEEKTCFSHSRFILLAGVPFPATGKG